MRTYAPSFSYASAASEKYPRFVVGILFETDSLYFTSHTGIPGVPGIVIENVLTVKDAVSQRIIPDEGRSEIGVVDFDLLDLDAAVTEAFRAKRISNLGLRGKTVVMCHGFAGAEFTQFQTFQTQKVVNCDYNMGVYSIRCADITREQRKDIFDPKSTRLAASISATDTTISVRNTAAFETVAHGSSYSDGPNATVGYIRIQDEIVRYAGKTDTTFTSCTRGVLNTRAVPHTVDLAVAEDQRTEVVEVIYLEMPAVKLILAILTGEIYDQAAELPDHWHLGIDPVWVRESDFTGIGTDLWNLADDSISFVPRFLGLKKTDGKKFLESEVYQLIGCYPLVYSDGTLGIRRMNRILADAPFVGVLDEFSIVSWSSLTLDMDGVINDYEVQWNFDKDDKPTRTTRLIDGNSISANGTAPRKTLQFRGLFGSRHTNSTVKVRLDAMRDRYAQPPALQRVSVLPSLNVYEVGDILRNRNPKVRDFYGTGDHIDRSMEIQRTRINLTSGDTEFELFGSTGTATTMPVDEEAGGEGPDGESSAPDAFYSSQGVALSTVVSMTLVGDVYVVSAGSYDVNGNADLNSSGAIYYHLGDLTIPDGAILNIRDNVQLRVSGFLTVNGDINGVGRGRAGVVDSSAYGTSAPGVAGFGSSRPMNGVVISAGGKGLTTFLNLDVPVTTGTTAAIAPPTLQVIDGSPPQLLGLPTDLRGSSGGAGGKITYKLNKLVLAAGGTGGDGGAGLCVICRGMAIGLSGSINLSGGNSSTPSTYFYSYNGGVNFKPGAGAPGCPGGLLIVLDGSSLSVPDLSGGRFLAITGASGAPRLNTMSSPSGGNGSIWLLNDDVQPFEGYLDPATTNSLDMSNSAYQIVYLPAIRTPTADQPSAVPAPSSLTATGVPNGISLTWTSPPFDLFDSTEIYMATTNNRAGATKIAEVKATGYTVPLAPGATRYFWIHNTRLGQLSAWEPTGATAGVSATSA